MIRIKMTLTEEEASLIAQLLTTESRAWMGINSALAARHRDLAIRIRLQVEKEKKKVSDAAVKT